MEEIRRAIGIIEALDLSKVTIDDIKEPVTTLLRGHCLTAPSFSPPLRLHRARKMDELPKFLADIGAPPPGMVRFDQRCNRAGQSMFYCSSARNAPFFEVHVGVGDLLVLSEWCTKVRLMVNHVGYVRSNFARLESSRVCPDWEVGPARFDPTDEMRVVDESLSSFFSVDVPVGREDLYKRTVAVAEKLIPEPTAEGAHRFVGLMYPTIPMNGNCDNFALKPDFVERGVEFVRAEFLRIRVIDGMKIEFDILDFANSAGADGVLGWKGRPGQWVLPRMADTLQFRGDGQGEWVALNTNGEVVPME